MTVKVFGAVEYQESVNEENVNITIVRVMSEACLSFKSVHRPR